MLARRLTTILPDMTVAEASETTRIHRVAGLTGARTALVATRPCHARHHTTSDVSLISMGQVPLPGDVSLAHPGMRLLDARAECRRHVLAGLRQPIEKGLTKRPSPGHPRSCRFGGTAGAGTDRRVAASARIVRDKAR